MHLKKIEGTYAVVRLEAAAGPPSWLDGPGLIATVRADDELTIVCNQKRVPRTALAQNGWACFRSIGPFPFYQTGVLLFLVAPLSTNGIGVFALCTFDGEHILCPEEDFERARRILIGEGHEFIA